MCVSTLHEPTPARHFRLDILGTNGSGNSVDCLGAYIVWCVHCLGALNVPGMKRRTCKRRRGVTSARFFYHGGNHARFFV